MAGEAVLLAVPGGDALLTVPREDPPALGGDGEGVGARSAHAAITARSATRTPGGA